MNVSRLQDSLFFMVVVIYDCLVYSMHFVLMILHFDRYVYLAKCLFMTSLRMKAFGLNDSWYDGVLTVMIFAVNETKCYQ